MKNYFHSTKWCTNHAKTHREVYQCCVTRVGTRTRVRTQVHFTRTRVQFFFHFDSDSDSEIVTRDSSPSHARVQAVAAVPCCAVYSDIWYILLFVFMFWKMKKVLNMWTTRFVTRTRISFLTRTRTLRWWLGLGLGLWGDDSDRTRTRTQRWWLGLGLGLWQPGLGHSTDVYQPDPHVGSKLTIFLSALPWNNWMIDWIFSRKRKIHVKNR